MAESIDESRTVWQSVNNIVGIERSLGAFWAALQDELDVIGAENLAFVEGEHHSSTSGADDYWVYTGECRSYRLEASDNGDEGVLKGVVPIQIELWRSIEEHPEPVWLHAKTPLIYVAFHRYPDPDSDGVGYYSNFGLDQYGTPYHEDEEGSPYRERTPLWIWDKIPQDVNEWSDSSWFFAVPLIAIRGYDDLREQITEPLRRLLIENRRPEDVFRERRAIPAVAVEGRRSRTMPA